MERLTDEHGICMDCDGLAYCRIDCFHKKVYDKLKYYEDLEEQGRLEIHMSEEEIKKVVEKKVLKGICLKCEHYSYTAKPCNQTRCPILAKLYE